MITFYGFILLQQWPCHLGTAPILCWLRGSACFMAMTATSGWVCMAADEYVPSGGVTCLRKGTELNIQTCECGRWLAAAEAATGEAGGGSGGSDAWWPQCCYDTGVNANSRRQMNGLTRNQCTAGNDIQMECGEPFMLL